MKNLYAMLMGMILLSMSLPAKEQPTTIYFQPNTTQLFTELYQAYGLLSPPERTFFENALYLDESIPPNPIPLQPSNQAIFDHADKTLTEFHKRAKDLELYVDPNQEKPFFYTALGSKHLIVALVYAIAMTEPKKKFAFAEQIPYYSGHPNAVTGIFHYPNARFIPFHHPSEIKLEPGEELIEFVTSPNNPDGKFRKPLTDAKIILADLVFASPSFGTDGTGYLDKNLEWIKQARNNGKVVFSFNSASKQFGKTGTRCGYIWYPIHDKYAASIFKNFFSFISYSAVAAGTSGLADFLNLIKGYLDLPDTGLALRQDGYKSLVKRHELVAKEMLNRYPGSTIISVPGSPTLFAKIKDSRIPNKKASDVIFEDFNVVVNNGEPMGETNEYIRLNLSGYSEMLADFLNRMAGQPIYKSQDVLFTSAKQTCSPTKVCSKEQSKTIYYVNPGDCLIEANASTSPIEIVLSPFIDYEKGNLIEIRKTDSSENQVSIKSDTFHIPLKSQDSAAKVQWSQPLYKNGHWEVL